MTKTVNDNTEKETSESVKSEKGTFEHIQFCKWKMATLKMET